MSNEIVYPARVNAMSPEDRQAYITRINAGYNPLIAAVQASLNERLATEDQTKSVVLVKVDLDARALWDEYLDSFESPTLRQENDCHCCRDFWKNWANVAVFKEDGTLEPILLSALTDGLEIPTEYRAFFSKQRDFSKLRAIRPVYSDDGAIRAGRAESNGFHHFHLEIPNVRQGVSVVKTPNQNAAETGEDVTLLRNSLINLKRETIKAVATMIKHDPRTKDSKFAPLIQRYVEFVDRYDAEAARHVKHNLLMWAGVRESKGFLRIGQGLLGELLQDIQEGVEPGSAMNAFVKRASGDLYMRPTAAPKEGAIQRAEKIFEELNLAPALRRRSLRRDEITTTIWTPAVVEEKAKPAGGVFDSVREEKAATPTVVDGGRTSASWIIRQLVEGEFTNLEFIVTTRPLDSLLSMTTAVDPEAPPLLRWDDPEKRNADAIYSYRESRYPADWGFVADTAVKVTALIPTPADRARYERVGTVDEIEVLLVLERGHDTASEIQLAIFPETLRAELHEVRGVIERYSQKGKLEDADKGLVVVFGLSVGNTFHATHKDGSVVKYFTATSR